MSKAILRELRVVLRKLAARPLYVVITVLVLAVGIGSNTTLFSIVDPLVLDPLPVTEPDRVVRLFSTEVRYDAHDLPLSWPDFEDIERTVESFSGVAAFHGRGFNLSGPTEPARVQAVEATSGFFAVLGVDVERGRAFDEEDVRAERRVAVLSHGFWRRQFASSRDILGRTLQLDGVAYEVVGVAPEEFALPSTDVDLWVPLQLAPEERERGGYALGVLARLAPGVTPEVAEEELSGLAVRLAEAYPDSHGSRGFATISLYDEVYGEGFRTAVLIFLLAVLFVYLIAVSNVANLLFLHAIAQEHELAVRSTLGARRSDLLRLFGLEALVLSLIAGGTGVLFGWGGTRAFLRLLPPDIPRLEKVALDGAVLGFTLALALVTALVCTMVPLVLVSRPEIAELLNTQGRTGHGGGRRQIRRILVGCELALACVLLVASLVLMRSFQHLRQVEPGFEPERLLTFLISPGEDQVVAGGAERLPALYERLLEEIAAIPGATSATFASELPGESASGVRFSVVGQPPSEGEEPVADLVIVGPGYFDTLGIPVSGRPVGRRDDETGAPVAVVNRAFAERYQSEDPLAGGIRLLDREWRVVGVAGDVRQGGLEDPVYPTVYVPHRQLEEPRSTVAVGVRTARADPLLLARPVQQAVDRVMTGVPAYRVQTMERILRDDIAGTWTMSRLLMTFAVIAWLLAGAGIYGTVAYSVAQRLHEVGVRMALGADRPQILKMILREGTVLAVVGTGFGILGSVAVTRLLTNWVHGIDAFDFASVASTAVLLTLTGILASLVAARRAVRVRPALLLSVQ